MVLLLNSGNWTKFSQKLKNFARAAPLLQKIDAPPGVQWVSKDAPGSTELEFGGLVR